MHTAIPADPNEPYWLSLWKDPDMAPPLVLNPPTHLYVTERLQEARDMAQTEYAFLKAYAHTRTKCTIPAPSWHRVYWHPVHARAAYPTAEDYLRAMRDYIQGVVQRVIAMGRDYVQLDAPNYGMFHCDAEARAFFAAQGRELAAELAFDVEVDNAVFAGISGVTCALHVCRGNNAGGRWVANGGYEAVAGTLFPHLTNIDTLLCACLIAGSYQPLSPTTLPDGTLVLHSDVLGLDLRLEGDTLRFYDPVTGQKLLSHEEIAQAWRATEQARREAEEHARREETARQAAEARIATLEARLRERGNT